MKYFNKMRTYHLVSQKSYFFTLTSRSKSKRSPGSICVETSAPVLAGTNKGVGGRSIHASVWQTASLSSILSVISSKYNSVWTGWCRRPSTGGGDFVLCSNSDWRFRASRARRFSAFLCKSTGCSYFRWLENSIITRGSILVQKSVWRSSFSRDELTSKMRFWSRFLFRIGTEIADTNYWKVDQNHILTRDDQFRIKKKIFQNLDFKYRLRWNEQGIT